MAAPALLNPVVKRAREYSAEAVWQKARQCSAEVVLQRARKCPAEAVWLVGVQVVMALKNEVKKTQNKDLDNGAEYRHLLVHAIHECAANFPDIAANVIHLLMDFLGDTNSSSALDVVRPLSYLHRSLSHVQSVKD